MRMRKVWSFPVLLSFPPTKKGKATVLQLLLGCLVLLPAALLAEDAEKGAVARGNSQAKFALTIQDNLLSLDAKDASLKEVLDEIGQRMHIEVVAQIPTQEKITLAFDRLSLEEALQRFSEYTNYVYLKGAEKEPGQISKIMIFPKREVTAPSPPTATESEPKKAASKAAPRPEPFKFEFDPSQYENKPQ
jgi:type II secretory pathway component GspD/PulD (secretin)